MNLHRDITRLAHGPVVATRATLAAFVILITICGALSAHAQAEREAQPRFVSLDEQPAFVARSAPALPFVQIYTLPDESGRVRSGAGYRQAVAQAYGEVFGADVRIALSDERFEPLDVYGPGGARVSSGDSRIDEALETLARGRQLFRAGDTTSAAEVLREGLQQASSTALPFTQFELLAESWETLALVALELSVERDEEGDSWRSLSRVALREMIRLSPERTVDPRLYPQRFFDAWRSAYREQTVATTTLLSVRSDEARALSAFLDIDLLVDVRIIEADESGQIGVRVYDRVDDRFFYDGLHAWEGGAEEITVIVERALSAALACLPPHTPPPAEEPSRLRDVYVYSNWLAFSYLERPTTRAFLNQGAELGAQFYFTENVGLSLVAQLAFSNRDADGDLLDTVQTSSISLSPSFQFVRDRYRIFLEAGPQLTRVSRVRATRSYWCKVSGGEPFQFDDERACLAEDITEQGARAQFAMSFRLGFALRIAGPLWAHINASSALYLLPFEGRAVDFPVGGSAGLMFQF